MSGPVSRPAIVRALLKKELIAYSRDKLYLFLTVLTLVAVAVLFLFLPDSVDETLALAVSPPIDTLVAEAQGTLQEMGASNEQLAALAGADFAEEQEGLLLIELDDEKELERVVDGSLEVWRTEDGKTVLRDEEAGDPEPEDAERISVQVGIAFPPSFIADVATGEGDTVVTVYSDADVPPEIQNAMTAFVKEAAYQLAGSELPVTMPDEDTIVLGEDRLGDQVTMRERFRPMIIFMILLMETFSMMSLISTEVIQRTVTAVLVTPAKTADFLTAKTIFGTMIGLTQGLIVMLIVGGMTRQNWSLMLAAILIGAVMFTGVAMVIGAAGKDFLSQLFYAMAWTIPLMIPALAVFFPGTAATWVKLIPTYPIMEVLYRSTVYEATWADSWGLLAYALVWLAVLYGLGLVTLRRKVESL